MNFLQPYALKVRQWMHLKGWYQRYDVDMYFNIFGGKPISGLEVHCSEGFRRFLLITVPTIYNLRRNINQWRLRRGHNE